MTILRRAFESIKTLPVAGLLCRIAPTARISPRFFFNKPKKYDYHPFIKGIYVVHADPRWLLFLLRSFVPVGLLLVSTDGSTYRGLAVLGDEVRLRKSMTLTSVSSSTRTG
ncbi:hypothetical protein FOZ60_001631 [Perkinsus olseni]|uniref:Uncharacterized protein n=1 Tax=Perkinsus olseni TaxID=32597 RepID=A0A7J6P136_PEROL|nr:hypothetical protein FOZ60_001631 [Perkinsus olseni]